MLDNCAVVVVVEVLLRLVLLLPLVELVQLLLVIDASSRNLWLVLVLSELPSRSVELLFNLPLPRNQCLVFHLELSLLVVEHVSAPSLVV